MEAKLEAVDSTMVQVLWTRHFLVAHGEYIPITTIYQDNKSTKNASREWKTIKQLAHQTPKCMIFFCHRQDKKGEVKVALCSTHDMLRVFFTKPLKGTLFT